jgi:hypothetical protein
MYGRTVGAIGVLAVPWTYDGAGEEVGYWILISTLGAI